MIRPEEELAKLAVWTLGSAKDRIAMGRGELPLPHAVLVEFGRLVDEGELRQAQLLWWYVAGRHWARAGSKRPDFYNRPSRLGPHWAVEDAVRLIRRFRKGEQSC